MTYLITFSCYGHRMHGDEPASVDRRHRTFGSPLVASDPERLLLERVRMKEQAYTLRPEHCELVLSGLKEVCLHRGWILYAAHVRTTHVHAVVNASSTPEAVMNAMKAYASRALNRSGSDPGRSKRWARHGSTRWLWDRSCFLAAVEYVARGQGAPMAVFEAESI